MLRSEAISLAFGSDSIAASNLDAFVVDVLSEITDTQASKCFNWAQRDLARRIKMYRHRVAMTLTASVDTYNLRDTAVFARKIVKPYEVTINGQPLRAADGGFGVWTLEEARRASSTWETLAAGTSARAIFYDEILILSPKPDAACVAAAANYISGECLPADFIPTGGSANLTGAVDMVEDVHEILCVMAVIKGAIPTIDSKTAWDQVRAMRSDADDVIEEVRSRNDNALSSFNTLEFVDRTEVDLW